MNQGRFLKRRVDGSYYGEEKKELKEKLKKGYSQMAELNLELAQKGFQADKNNLQNMF
ncbi:hypothetical protein MWH28_02030 [Natroniella sulfidigena]|uniref:hypothetical protein n=1 Tax=Natroniella sulfidigena TaxID=723921 RepID=UPI00200AAA8A|nr:hypothetical protein [Natroniella sulfidigena]MCK8816142.1 hypothetical protein [Natroniella sulfidigena]